MNYSLELATEKDVAQINKIINYYIETSGANWSWHPRSLDEAKEWFLSHNYSIHPIYVAKTEDNIVIGYASLSSFRGKDGYWPVAENSIYLHKDYIGQNIGNKLMEILLNHAYKSKLEVVTAWIDSQNISSIDFHKKWGFEVVGQMKNIGYKFNKRHSVTILQLSVIKEEL